MLKRKKYEGDYYKYQAVNNSLLSVYREDPLLFWNKFLLEEKEKEADNKYMRVGRMVHAYLLEPDKFLKRYKISKSKLVLPKSENQEKFAKDIVEGVETTMAYKQNYKCSYIESNMPVIKKAIELREELKGYIEQLMYPEFVYIDPLEMKVLEEVKENYMEHNGIKRLLEEKHFTEFEVRFEHNDLPCKSLLDFVTEDASTIVDIKTSSYSPVEFIRRIKNKENTYLQQVAFYTWALKKHDESLNPRKYYIIYINMDTKNVYLIDIQKQVVYKEIESIMKDMNIITDSYFNWNYKRTLLYEKEQMADYSIE